MYRILSGGRQTLASFGDDLAEVPSVPGCGCSDGTEGGTSPNPPPPDEEEEETVGEEIIVWGDPVDKTVSGGGYLVDWEDVVNDMSEIWDLDLRGRPDVPELPPDPTDGDDDDDDGDDGLDQEQICTQTKAGYDFACDELRNLGEAFEALRDELSRLVSDPHAPAGEQNRVMAEMQELMDQILPFQMILERSQEVWVTTLCGGRLTCDT